MPYTVELLPSAARELASLPRDVQRRIARRIDTLAADPHPPGATALAGGERLFRLRVGDYRVIYRVEQGRLVVLVVRIGHRREVYRSG